MRVSQVHTLVWIGNVLLVAAAGWVGMQFWEAKKASGKAPATEWPDANKATPTGPKWPGEIKSFSHIWDTPLSGVVPPPPEKEKPATAPKQDAAAELKKKLKILAPWVGVPRASSTTVLVEFGGKQVSLGYGAILEDTVDGKPFRWQLVKVSLINHDTTGVLRFQSSQYEKNDGYVDVEQPVVAVPDLTEAAKLFIPDHKGVFDPFEISKTVLTEQAYFDREAKAWRVPAAEALWWQAWGEEVVSALKTQDLKSPEGQALGVKLMSSPGQGTAVGSDRGLAQGDVIKSINGTAVSSMADITQYLRGPGKELDTYVVVVERDGAERTVRYEVARRNRS